jgi:mRNA-degrading endonuclease RelE of RelBE toxin-antitoxin system
LHGLNALRVRVGDWRVIIKIEDDVLYVTRIRPRGDVYKRK